MVCWRIDLHPCLMVLLLFLVADCLAACVWVCSSEEQKVEVDVMFGAEEQGQAQPMRLLSLACSAQPQALWIGTRHQPASAPDLTTSFVNSVPRVFRGSADHMPVARVSRYNHFRMPTSKTAHATTSYLES